MQVQHALQSLGNVIAAMRTCNAATPVPDSNLTQASMLAYADVCRTAATTIRYAYVSAGKLCAQYEDGGNSILVSYLRMLTNVFYLRMLTYVFVYTQTVWRKQHTSVVPARRCCSRALAALEV